MNNIKLFGKAQQLKRISKRIQQLSYSLNKIEQRFELETLEDKELYDLVEIYLQTLNELKIIFNEIKLYENQNNTDSVLA